MDKKNKTKAEIRKAMGLAAERRAKQIGVDVNRVTGLGMADVSPAPGGMEQRPLFGELDQVVNVLELERADINVEIAKCQKTILQKNAEISDLTERRNLLEKALATSKKMAMDGAKGKKEKGGKK